MKSTRTVILYGNSLVVTSLAASLADLPHLILHQFDATMPDLAQRLKSLGPDVLIFDLATAHPDYAIALLKEYPQLLLIGVDASSARMMVLSGQQSQALTIDDLTRVIDAHPAPASGPGANTHSPGD